MLVITSVILFTPQEACTHNTYMCLRPQGATFVRSFMFCNYRETKKRNS